MYFSCPTVCEVCLNYEVVILQTQTGKPPDLGSVDNCYVAIICITATPFYFPPPDFRPGGLPAHSHPLYPFPTVMSPRRNICPHGRHLYPYQHTKAHRPLYQIPLPPCLPHPLHAFRIPNAMHLSPSKYILTLHSDASEPPFFATTSHSTTPPSLVAHIPVTNIKYRTQLHPLRHCCLPLVNVRPPCLHRV